MFSRNELQSLHKGGPPSTKKHAACRLIELLKSVPEDKLTPVALQTRDQLQQICSNAGGLNVKGKGQRGVVARLIDTLEQEGLGEYLFVPEVKQNTNVNQQKSSLEQKLETVFGTMDVANSTKKLKAIQKYISHWSEEASNSEKQNSKVSASDIKKLLLLKPVVNSMIASSTAKNVNVNVNYPNSEWHPIVENIWGTIPGNASNINAPPAENNTKKQSPVQNNNSKNNFNNEQSPVQNNNSKNNFNNEQSPVQNNNSKNNFNNEQSPVQNNNSKNNFNNEQSPVQKNNTKNITQKITIIQKKINSILKNMQKISAAAAGGKRNVTRRKK
jgi:hypothetical protein